MPKINISSHAFYKLGIKLLKGTDKGKYTKIAERFFSRDETLDLEGEICIDLIGFLATITHKNSA